MNHYIAHVLWTQECGMKSEKNLVYVLVHSVCMGNHVELKGNVFCFCFTLPGVYGEA